jgi:dihydrolipoamide dehydrogenase
MPPPPAYDGRDEGGTYDVVVIGAGTAGLAAAKAAHAEGARVAVVDRGPLGTFCARLGCMPSKALLQSATTLARTRNAGELGVELDARPRLSWPAVRARKDAIVRDFVAEVVRDTKTSTSFTLLRGAAKFVDGTSLTVDGRRVVARRWIVATGSIPVRPEIAGLADVAALTLVSDDVLELDAVPESVAVVGCGAVGVELGQLLARAGARVHLLLGHDDRVAGLPRGPLQESLVAALSRELTVHRAVKIERLRRDGADEAAVTVVLANGETLRVERLLLAAGRRPDVDALDLAAAGVQVHEGVPVHDEHLRTTNPAVFVAGDAAGAPGILHAATIEGRTAGRNATRKDLERPDLAPTLRVVFCDPIVATVGQDPAEATSACRPVCVVRRPWSQQGKARIMGETDGMAQLVVDRETRRVLGCQLVGPEADLLVHLASYAIHFGATVDDLLALHHYHPTLAEMFPSLAKQAVAELDGAECLQGEIAATGAMQ